MDVTKKPEVVRSFLPLRPVQFHILISLSEGDRHGYGIIRDTTDRSGGEVRLEMGTLYRALHRMLGAGLVAESDERAKVGKCVPVLEGALHFLVDHRSEILFQLRVL